MQLEVTRAALREMLQEAERVHPVEACGILLGKHGRIAAVEPATNIHSEPLSYFEIDPQTLIDAHRNARNGGLEVLGYFHSHPTSAPIPSKTDQDSAAGDGSIWAITGQGRTEFWRDTAQGFEPLSYRAIGR